MSFPDFIIVGGVAAILHGLGFTTYDLDVVYSRDRENIRRIVQALGPYQPYLRGAPPGLPFHLDELTLRNGLNFTLVTSFGDLDLLGEVTVEALRGVDFDLFEREFMTLTAQINRDAQCAEIYHPETGAIYGGLEEAGRGPNGMDWTSCARQSWTASAYLRMLLTGIFGLRLSPERVTFQPYLPAGIPYAHLQGVFYRGCTLDLTMEGPGGRLAEFQHHGMTTEPFLPAGLQGEQHLHVSMAE